MSRRSPAELAAALHRLRTGTLEVEGRLVDASNATLFCSLNVDGDSVPVVYKPVAGERPLWDFPDGTLAGREVAAYEVSAATGWEIVPPTVLREGPFGPGMCQLWVDIDETVDLGALVRSDHPGLRRMAVFDAVVNNSDRKGGHVLPTPDGHLYGVDHGVTFSVDDKLRTVLWRWRGRRLTAEAVEMLAELRSRLSGELGRSLTDLITPRELAATRARVAGLLRAGRHPQPSGDWPAVPWPPF